MVKKVIGNYNVIKAIGSGGFSKVFLAQHAGTGEEVAIKRINKETNNKEKIIREINLMRSLDHPFAVQFFELIEDEKYFYIVMEYVKGTTLLDLVNNSGRMPEWKVRHIFVEIVNCVSYLHKELNIAHRDIKLENIIFDTFGNIRLIDFGLGNKFDISDGILQTACGSPAYAPPEMFLGIPYTDAADMWSIGCVLYAMVTNRLPFEDANAKQLAAKIVYQQPEFPADMKPTLVNLISTLLNKDPSQRPTAENVLKLEWVNSYPNRELFSSSFGLDEKWRDRKNEVIVDQAILNDLNNLNILTDKVKSDVQDGLFTPESAKYRILKRKKVALEMSKLYENADISLEHVLGKRRPHFTLTPTAFSAIRRTSVCARNKYMFANVCSPVSGVSRLSATVKLSNKLNGNRARTSTMAPQKPPSLLH